MTDIPQLDEALALALQLPAKDRLKLVEKVVSSLELEIEKTEVANTEEQSWGAKLVEALESGEIDTSEWMAMDIDDPVEWVKRLRLEQAERRRKHWDETE